MPPSLVSKDMLTGYYWEIGKLVTKFFWKNKRVMELDRVRGGAWWDTVHRVAQSDTTEETKQVTNLVLNIFNLSNAWKSTLTILNILGPSREIQTIGDICIYKTRSTMGNWLMQLWRLKSPAEYSLQVEIQES